MSRAPRAIGTAGPDAPLRVPATVVRIVQTLERAGHESWCVGGAVRDALLGLADQDWDVATAATPPEVRRLFRRTVPVGIEFGTVGVLDDDGRMHEVTTFRHDVRTDGRHAVVAFGASLDEDLARRDFTINAIAWHPLRAALHDPYGGRDDLRAGLVRAVGEPEERLREDRLRALRAIRFASRLGFDVEPRTWEAVVASAPHLGRLSAERVKQELDKTMEQVGRAGGALAMWRDAGALAALVPALAEVSDLALAALDRLPRAVGAHADARRMMRHAALFADVPRAALAPALRDLKFSNASGAAVQRVVAGWQAVGAAMAEALLADDPPGDERVRRWVAAIGRLDVGPVLRLAAARWDAGRDAGLTAPSPAAVRALYRRLRRAAFTGAVAVADLAIGGDELRAAGIPAGPGMARMLHRLLDAVLADPSRNTVDGLLALVRELAAAEPAAAHDAGRAGRERTGS